MNIRRARSRRRAKRPSRFSYPAFEHLERRLLLTMRVNVVDDAPDEDRLDGVCLTENGYCTLRAAIQQANKNPGLDLIEFEIPGTGPHSIQLDSALPTITDPITIDGYTQPGSQQNSNSFEQGSDALPGIVLDGGLLPFGHNGLVLETGGSIIQGLAIQGFKSTGTCKLDAQTAGFGIVLGLGAGGNLVEGNFLGVGTDGSTPIGNTSGINVASPSNTIRGNVISGNDQFGIQIGGRRTGVVLANVTGNKVLQNYIGTDKTGQLQVSNDQGIMITWGASQNTIGGDWSNHGNVISGNAYQGILIDSQAGDQNVIQGNRIGTDVTGSTTSSSLGNGADGIEIVDSANNTIGGAAGLYNVIAGNGTQIPGSGVLIVNAGASGNEVVGNRIGTDRSGTVGLPNTGNGVEFQNAPENSVHDNVISGNLWHGVAVRGKDAKQNVIVDNVLGTDRDGVNSLGNGNAGVAVFSAADTTIQDNVISGNDLHGVLISGVTAQNNVLTGNLIGTNKDGAAAVPNRFDGVHITNATANKVGSQTAPNEPNIISGNLRDGVRIEGKDATKNLLQLNVIGLQEDKDMVLPNQGDGVHLRDAWTNEIGTTQNLANIISGNRGHGVYVSQGSFNTIQGNLIGLDAGGTKDRGNEKDGIQLHSTSLATIGLDRFTGTDNQRNVISGHKGTSHAGIRVLGGTKNEIFGNYIGTDKTAKKPVANRTGVALRLTSENEIGGLQQKQGNVISGNLESGVLINESSRNVLQGNVIGLQGDHDTALPNQRHGIHIKEASRNEIGKPKGTGLGNTISANKGNGIFVEGGPVTAELNTFQNNIIGLNEKGDSARGNLMNGIELITGHNNTIGGVSSTHRNIISAHSGAKRAGIRIQGGLANKVQGNYIGTNLSGGGKAFGNFDGVLIDFSGNNKIGGPQQELGNVISGNLGNGVAIVDNLSLDNEFEANLIGLASDGLTALGNVGHGIYVKDADKVWIGQSAAMPNRENVISSNGGHGIFLEDVFEGHIKNSRLGTDRSGTLPRGNKKDGIYLHNSTQIVVGGFQSTEGNLISGHNSKGMAGIRIVGVGDHQIEGNRIGTNQTGDGAIPNDTGLILRFTDSNKIGAAHTLRGNLISGNLDDGISVRNKASNTTIQGNTIGLKADQDARLPNGGHGVNVVEAQNTHIGLDSAIGFGNLISGNKGNGIFDVNSTGTEIRQNFIGVNLNGNADRGNDKHGIHVMGSNVQIGGEYLTSGNVISGHDNTAMAGIFFDTGTGTVEGNYIGTTADAKKSIPNESGIVLFEGGSSVIGGTTSGLGNVISGNADNGITIGQASQANSLYGNMIGVQRDRVSPLANGGHGVLLLSTPTVLGSGTVLFKSDNEIGGLGAGEGNVIAYNGGAGIRAPLVLPDVILSNSIFFNTDLGIDRGAKGPTPNDLSETDGIQNHPVLHQVTTFGSSTHVYGYLVSKAQTSYTIQFFQNATCDEGRALVATTTITTGSGGTATLELDLPAVPVNSYLTATATEGTANTSEFSNCVPVLPDSDGDTVPDKVEALGPNGGDIDGDGNPDSGQAQVAAIRSGVNGAFVGITIDTGSIRSIESTANPAPTPPPAGFTYPTGFFRTVIDVLVPGTSLVMKYIMPPGTVKSSFYKYGPTPANPADHWYDFAYDGTTGAQFQGDTILLHLVDGGRGDNDLTANGTIVDPGGLGVPIFSGLVISGPALTDPVAVGGRLTYSYRVTNAAADPADEVVFQDRLPDGAGFISATSSIGSDCDYLDGQVTCQLGSLNSGAGIDVVVEAQAIGFGELINTVDVSGDVLEEFDFDNAVTTVTNVAPPLTIVVNSADDANDGVADATHTSLREAISLSNRLTGVQRITFDIPGSGPHTIQVGEALPELYDPVIIDGTTEPDYVAAPVVVLDGSQAGTGANGLVVRGGYSTIRGLAISRFIADPGVADSGSAVVLNSSGNIVEANYLGTDPSGTSRAGNQGSGILVGRGNNRIGGSAAKAGNVISGNQGDGILVLPFADSNVIQQNLIGVNASGDAALGNAGSGIYLHSSSFNLIGGGSPQSANTISGNAVGVRIAAGLSRTPTENHIAGNRVGTDATGQLAIGNQIGVALYDADRNTIGANIISGNHGSGIELIGHGPLYSPADVNLVHGNSIGVAADGTTGLGNGADGVRVDWWGSAQIGGPATGMPNQIAYNVGDGVAVVRSATTTIRANGIHANTGLGIDVGNDGPQVNAPASTSAFAFPANYPVISRVFSGGGSTTIEGTITGPDLPAQGIVATVIIDFFVSAELDPSGYGEGATYLGSITTQPRGPTSFTATIPLDVPAGHFVTGTATRESATSEFSPAIETRADADGDGVVDVIEDAGPNAGDANQDGTPDRQQNHIASLPNSTDGRYVILESAGATFRGVAAVENPAPHTGPPEVSFPVGFFEFTLLGSTSTITVRPPSDVTLATAYNFGPSVDRNYDHWYQLPAVDAHADRVELPFSDGGALGDHDLELNGRIVTLTGPAAIPAGAGTTIVVNADDDVDDGSADATHTSLREAINRANFLPGKDRILFSIPGPGPHVIQPASSPNPVNPNLVRVGLPWITDPVVIDGYSQPGSVPASGPASADLRIVVDGSLAQVPVNGLDLRAGDSTVRGLAINRFRTNGFRGGAQIVLASSDNVIEGNHIGSDAGGTVAYDAAGVTENQRYGILVDAGKNLVGGDTAAARNVISGLNSSGIYLGGGDASENLIAGNYIGTTSAGTAGLGNNTGIHIDGSAHDNRIGGLAANRRNVISGNDFAGISIASCGFSPHHNQVIGNFIGTDVAGTQAVANGSAGIQIVSGVANVIGGGEPGAANVVSGNDGPGIIITSCEAPSWDNIVQGNVIGSDAAGRLALGNAGDGVAVQWATDSRIEDNTIAWNVDHGVAIEGLNGSHRNTMRGNRIFDNGALGVDLGRDGVTANDSQQAHQIAPQLLNVNVGVQAEMAMARGKVLGAPDSGYKVSLFFNPVGDRSLGVWDIFVTTDAGGNASFDESFWVGDAAFLRAVVADVDTTIPNQGQNYPVLTAVTIAGGVTIEGSLSSVPEQSFSIDLFRSSQPDQSGHGEGASYLGSVEATTDAAGIALFEVTFDTRIPLSHWITATATDRGGNTSEFSLAAQPVPVQIDFGDALGDAIPTLLSANGARHIIVPGYSLGLDVDADADGQPTGDADGDDSTDADDEDGVRWRGEIVAGRLGYVDLSASASGRLDAWIDFNGNRDWSDAGEHVFDSHLLVAGQNQLSFAVPGSAVTGEPVMARFRFSSQGGLSPGGIAADGEVEDTTVTIVAALAPPVANDDLATTLKQTLIRIDVADNDTDIDGDLDTRSVVIVSPPGHGQTIFDGPAGTVTYFPDPEFLGTDSFVYEISDRRGLTDTAAVSVQVLPSNQPPVAIDDQATTPEDMPVVIDVAANDTDPEGHLDPASVQIIALPEYGSLTVDFGTGQVTYVPDTNYHGGDLFEYLICDALAVCDTAAVTLSVEAVNDPPVAQDDMASMRQGAVAEIDVLENDSDTEGNLDPDTLEIVDPPASGSVQITATGTIAYAPAEEFTGSDRFVYEVCDTDGACTMAEVTIEVTADKLPPQAMDDQAETAEDQEVEISVADNDVDPDNDLDVTSVQIVVPPKSGMAMVDESTGMVTYVPDEDFAETDWFEYQISDVPGATDTALVEVRIEPVNDPPVAEDDFALVDAHQPAVLEILANDTDSDGRLAVNSVVITSTPAGAVVTTNDDGTVVYSPNAGFVGEDSFAYTVQDEAGAVSNDGTVRVVIAGDADPAAAISGFVYADVNNNGVKEPVEVGLPHVPVSLSGPTSATVVTDASGAYRFENLPAGTYSVSETQPGAFIDGIDSQGNPLLGEVSNDRFIDVSLASGVVATDYNFGERGLRNELVTKQLYLASTPSMNELMLILDVDDGWFSFQSDADGVLTTTLLSPAANSRIEAYTGGFMPIVLDHEAAELSLPIVGGEQYVLHLSAEDFVQQLEYSVMLLADNGFVDITNPVEPRDVDNDGYVHPLDALVLINELNARNAGNRPAPQASWFYDVTADGLLTPLDALTVINYLNARADGEATPWAPGPSPLGLIHDGNGWLDELSVEVSRRMERNPLVKPSRAWGSTTTLRIGSDSAARGSLTAGVRSPKAHSEALLSWLARHDGLLEGSLDSIAWDVVRATGRSCAPAA